MIEQGRNTKVREVTIFLRTLSLLLSRVSWSTPPNDNYLEQVWKTTRLWSMQSSNGWWTLQSPEAQVCQNPDVTTQSPIFCIFFRPKSDYCLALSVCHWVTDRFGFWMPILLFDATVSVNITNPRFYHNAGKCEQFIYGGCRGNENNFASLEACQVGDFWNVFLISFFLLFFLLC